MLAMVKHKRFFALKNQADNSSMSTSSSDDFASLDDCTDQSH